MREELGAAVKYELGEPKVFFRVERLEHATNKTVRIFAVGYESKYLGGKIELGKHHDTYEWVNAKTFKPKDYFEGGWEQGLMDYQKLIV